MKKFLRCLFIVLILCFSVSPVYARAGGGGGGSGGGGGGSGSPSHHSSSPVRYVDTPERRITSLITFSLISYGFSYMKKYRRRYKAISMHKAMKQDLKQNNTSFDEKKMNEVVADYYYTIQNAWNDRDMDVLKQCLSPSLYEQWQTKLNWWEY